MSWVVAHGCDPGVQETDPGRLKFESQMDYVVRTGLKKTRSRSSRNTAPFWKHLEERPEVGVDKDCGVIATVCQAIPSTDRINQG